MINAVWYIDLICDCPSCNQCVNLIDTPDFWEGRSIEPGEHDTEDSNELEVVCPECKHEFTVCCVY